MKKWEIKTVCQSSKDSLAPWSLDAAQIGKMVELGKIFLMYIVGTVVRKKREVKIYWVIEEVDVSGDFKDDFWNM